MKNDRYDADYFLRGQELGISGYTDYRWMPELTMNMAGRMIAYLGIRPDETILDFGCARGYVVKALRRWGRDAWGRDVSKWALENADAEAKPYISNKPLDPVSDSFDWIIAKDVLEHVPDNIGAIINMLETARIGVFAVVPLSAVDGEPYEVPSYEEDVTHIHRLTLRTWAGFFMRPGWTVTASYRVKGIKDNYAHYPMGNGFITARRIYE